MSARISHSVVFPDLRYKKPNFGAADFLFAKNKIKGVKKSVFLSHLQHVLFAGKPCVRIVPRLYVRRETQASAQLLHFTGKNRPQKVFSLSQDHGTRFPATKKSFPTPDVRRDFVETPRVLFSPLAAVIRARKENNDKKVFFSNVNGRRIHFPERKKKSKRIIFREKMQLWRAARLVAVFENCRA